MTTAPVTMKPGQPPQQLLEKRECQPQHTIGQTANNQTENEEPQPQVVVAFGFRMTNWEPSRPSV